VADAPFRERGASAAIVLHGLGTRAQARNLASCILAAAKCLGHDWKERYGYDPVLLETFVDRDRFRGTCYRAANWLYVGETQGRGKLDRQHRGLSTNKDLYLYPLNKHFRHKLCPTPDG